MLILTESAAAQIREAASRSDAQEMALRVAAQVNGAGMLEFGLGFDDEQEGDSVIDAFGVKVLVGPDSAGILNDMTIDFGETAPGQMSFVFLRSGGSGSCGSGGCGGGSCGSGGCHG